jgi:hypothetical protein
MKLSDLKENEINPRKIEREQLDRLKESIERDPEFLTMRPIVIEADGTILAGNQRYAALKELGRDEIPDEWVLRCPADLSEEKRKRFILIDNSPDGMSGDWKLNKLLESFADIDLGALGFDLEAMGEAIDTVKTDTIEVEEEEKKVCTCPKCNHEFEIN